MTLQMRQLWLNTVKFVVDTSFFCYDQILRNSLELWMKDVKTFQVGLLPINLFRYRQKRLNTISPTKILNNRWWWWQASFHWIPQDNAWWNNYLKHSIKNKKMVWKQRCQHLETKCGWNSNSKFMTELTTWRFGGC